MSNTREGHFEKIKPPSDPEEEQQRRFANRRFIEERAREMGKRVASVLEKHGEGPELNAAIEQVLQGQIRSYEGRPRLWSEDGKRSLDLADPQSGVDLEELKRDILIWASKEIERQQETREAEAQAQRDREMRERDEQRHAANDARNLQRHNESLASLEESFAKFKEEAGKFEDSMGAVSSSKEDLEEKIGKIGSGFLGLGRAKRENVARDAFETLRRLKDRLTLQIKEAQQQMEDFKEKTSGVLETIQPNVYFDRPTRGQISDRKAVMAVKVITFQSEMETKLNRLKQFIDKELSDSVLRGLKSQIGGSKDEEATEKLESGSGYY